MAVEWQDSSLDDLKRALKDRQIGTAIELVGAFVRYIESKVGRAGVDECTDVLEALREGTRFAEMVRVGETLRKQQAGERFVGTPVPGGDARQTRIEFEAVQRDTRRHKSAQE